MKELDFYFSQKQLNITTKLSDFKHYTFFKGKLYTECCDKGYYKNNKNNFSDSIYLGFGKYNDITFK